MREDQIQVPLIHHSDSPGVDAGIPENHSEQENTRPYTSISLAELNVELIQLQSEWRSLLEAKPLNGDAWYVISRAFLIAALNATDEMLPHLASTLGPIVNTSIVDANGILFPENEEPVASTHVSPNLYLLLESHFGLRGQPVIRHVLVDERGNSMLERFPPYFIVHLLCKQAPATKASIQSAGLDAHLKHAFLLSQTKTFRDLMQTIDYLVYKERKSPMRLWFITTDNVEELPANIPISLFIDRIQRKKIVSPQVLDCLLQSQGIRSSRLHLVVEPLDKVSKKFLMDQALSTTNLSLLDIEKVTTSGGNLGLSNLGNTCYMNSALQCLVHVPEINYYFFYDLYEKELNRTNPLGNLGNIAVAFSNLLHKLFDFTGGVTSLITPREFKYTVGRHSSMFHGYQQQDSQEFLSWLLDALHEDLNRIQNKPYYEKPELKDEDVDNVSAIISLANRCWELHKKRNDSIIVDLFTGMYQSTLVCPVCSKTSITFDPFNDLTLPLPVDKRWYHEFTIVDLSGSFLTAPIMKFEVELTKSSTYEDLVAYLSKHLLVPLHYLFLFEIFRNFFYKNFLEENDRYSFLPISEIISDSDDIFVYIIPHTESDRIVPVISTAHDEDKSYNITEPFGIPWFIVFSRSEESTEYGIISKKVADIAKLLSRHGIEPASNINQNEKHQCAINHPDKMVEKEKNALNSLNDTLDVSVRGSPPYTTTSNHYELKYYRDSVTEQDVNMRENVGKNLDTSTNDSGRKLLRIPKGRPRFGKLPRLIDRLSGTRQGIVSLKNLGSNVSEENLSRAKFIHSIDDQNPGVDDKILGENDGGDCKLYLMNDDELHLPGENSDTDTNWDNLDGIFASVDDLEPSVNTSNLVNVSKTRLGSEKKIGPPCVDGNDLLVIDWHSQFYNQYFGDENRLWENLSYIPNPELEKNKAKFAAQQKATISLYDCLRNFSTPEVLGDQDLWYCPKCKDHRRATKSIQIWSTGDILTIHLKRFQSARSLSDKINMVVDFPIEGLNISDFVTSNQTDKESLVYDLIGVDNHYGGLGGGHYTASVRNFRDGKWYYFNDGRVTSIEDPKECVTGAAYLLFYKKRGPSQFSGGPFVESSIAKGREFFEQRLASMKELLLQVMEEIESYYWHETNDDEIVEKEAEDLHDESNENLYGGDSDDDITQLRSASYSNSSKKSRSPITEQNMKFENQRKQRLISKGSDLPRSVNINLNYSSSASNLASPGGSSEEEKDF